MEPEGHNSSFGTAEATWSVGGTSEERLEEEFSAFKGICVSVSIGLVMWVVALLMIQVF